MCRSPCLFFPSHVLIMALLVLCGTPFLCAKDFKIINQLPQHLTEARVQAQKGWDSGATSAMKSATSKYNEALVTMISELAKTYYPEDQPTQQDVQAYLKALYTVHRFKQNAANPSGESQGSLASLDVLSEVTDELEQTVIDMVTAVASGEKEFDLEKWKKQWEKAHK